MQVLGLSPGIPWLRVYAWVALDLSGKPGWSGGSARCGWYGPGARLGPPPPVGKLGFLGTAGTWPTVVCVVHGPPLWLLALPFLCQVGSWVIIPVVWYGFCDPWDLF